METKKKVCCVFGHRKIADKDTLKPKLEKTIENLIIHENVVTFLLGSKSEFDDLCREILCSLKEKYPHIERVYIRAEFPYITESYEKYLLESCDRTYFPESIINAGKAVYIERNREMIDNCDICLVYFKTSYLPPLRKHSKRDVFQYQPKSGTDAAYKYAILKNRQIINMVE